MKLKRKDIPKEYPVRPLTSKAFLRKSSVAVTCWECGLSWDDSVSTALTPAPAGRCPFESFHRYEVKVSDLIIGSPAKLHCEVCGEDYSSDPGDYFMHPKDRVFTCCGENMILAIRRVVYEKI